MVTGGPKVVSSHQHLPEYLNRNTEPIPEEKTALFALFNNKPKHRDSIKQSIPGQLVELEPGNLIITYKGPGKVEADCATLSSNCPISKNCGIYYYEVTIQSKGRDGFIGVGFSTNPNFAHKIPGTSEGSWGYHASDGKKYGGSATGKIYGPSYTTGDVIGCCVNFADNSISFTRNGIMLGVAFEGIFETSTNLYCSVGLRTPGEKVSTNFGKNPFVFDIAQFYQDEKQRICKLISNSDTSGPREASIINRLVVDYLVKSGYSETAKELYKASLGQGDILDETGVGYEDIPGAIGIKERHYVQSLILEGDINGAIKFLQQNYPVLLVAHPLVHCQLHCLQFIEMLKFKTHPEIMKTDDEDDQQIKIVMYGRQITDMFKDSMDIINAAIQELVTLLCYDDPESSPLSYLLDERNRSTVAVAANEAMLQIQNVEPVSKLELIYKQLMAVELLMFEYSSGSAVLADMSNQILEHP